MSYPYQPNSASQTVAVSNDERKWAVVAHISTIIAAVLSAGWLSLVGPFLVWLFNKDKSSFVRQSAAGAFNFNLIIWAMTIAGWICAITIIGLPIAVILWAIAFCASLYCHIKGAIKANRGELYRYPWGITVLS